MKKLKEQHVSTGALEDVTEILASLCIKKYPHHIYPIKVSMPHIDIMGKGLIHPQKIYQSITPRPLLFKIVKIKEMGQML